MAKKIKNFKCEQFTPEGLQGVEDKINEFTRTHDTLDIKVTSCCNSFGWMVMYAVIYEED